MVFWCGGCSKEKFEVLVSGTRKEHDLMRCSGCGWRCRRSKIRQFDAAEAWSYRDMFAKAHARWKSGGVPKEWLEWTKDV